MNKPKKIIEYFHLLPNHARKPIVTTLVADVLFIVVMILGIINLQDIITAIMVIGVFYGAFFCLITAEVVGQTACFIDKKLASG